MRSLRCAPVRYGQGAAERLDNFQRQRRDEVAHWPAGAAALRQRPPGCPLLQWQGSAARRLPRLEGAAALAGYGRPVQSCAQG